MYARRSVTDMWVNGKQLMAARRLLTIDEAAVIKVGVVLDCVRQLLWAVLM